MQPWVSIMLLCKSRRNKGGNLWYSGGAVLHSWGEGQAGETESCIACWTRTLVGAQSHCALAEAPTV